MRPLGRIVGRSAVQKSSRPRAAEIIVACDGILRGTTQSSLTHFLGRELTKLELVVDRIQIAPDDSAELALTIASTLTRQPRVVVVAGGRDSDVGLSALASASARRLEQDCTAVEILDERLAPKLRTADHDPYTTSLEGADLIMNSRGLALGVMLQVLDTLLISLPIETQQVDAMWPTVEQVLREKLALELG